MSSIRLHFWDWNEPVLRKAVAELMDGWSGGELDLSDKVVLVPTAETGKRLREALALAVAEKDGAVTAPYVWHPETALWWGIEESRKATPLQEKLAWMKVLQGITAADYTSLFPAMPDPVDAAWVRSTAETLCGLKHTLGAGGYDLQAVAKVLEGEMDHARWSELAVLEKAYGSALALLKKEDAQALKRGRAQEPGLPAGIKQIWVMAMIDPPLLLRQWLANVSRQIPVHIFVHAPANKGAAYDAIGAPRLEVWSQQGGVPSFLRNEDIIIVSSLQDQAIAAMDSLKKMGQQGMALAVGACDPALNAHLESAFAGEDCQAYDPSGRTAATHVFLELIRIWQRVVQSGAWHELATFLRLDDVVRALSSEEVSQSRLLQWLDDIHAEHLPPTLEDAINLIRDEKHQPLRLILERMQTLEELWRSGSCRDALQNLLQWIYGDRDFETEHESDRDYVKLAGAAMQLAEELDEIQAALKLPSAPVELLGLLLEELESTKLADIRGDVDFVLHGWLELPWEPAAGLVITGFNEEHVPGIVTGDPFLPDKLRQQLGLASQASRLARDRALLSAMVGQRQQQGTIRIVLGKTNKQGDSLRPSRLLFDCGDEALVARVRHLFPKDESSGCNAEPPRHIGFQLRPPRQWKGLDHISPSAISAYLTCPFRFYLGRVLKMESVDAQMREATAMDFGNLLHDTLKDYAIEPAMQDCVDGRVIAGYLDASIVKKWRVRYGDQPLLPVEMQLETARQRLAAAAEKMAAIRAEGWRTIYAEKKVDEWGLDLAGVPFSGKLDRVDQHVSTKALRLWDYKTGRLVKPADAHLTKVSDKEARPWVNYQKGDGKPRRWSDVQLPLYIWALRQKHPGIEISAAYFMLPATVTATGEQAWSDLDDDMVTDAVRCGEEVVKHLQAGEFWPPVTDLKYDDYEFLLGDPLMTVDASLLTAGGVHE
ncbi:PD-(D/E)XK nuclease family protein [soil metagenome]